MAEQIATNPALNDFLTIRAKFGAPDPDDLMKAGEAAIKQKAVASGAAASAIGKGIKQRNDLVSTLSDAPKAPEINTKIPDAPDMQFRNPEEAFSSLAPTLAVFGSLLTRRPLINALTASAAAMDGYRQGDKDVYERKRQIWEDQTKKALDQTKLELDQYRAAREKYSDDIAGMHAKMQAIAANNQDQHTMAALQSAGGASAAFQILELREKNAEALTNQFAKFAGAKGKNSPTLSDDAIDTYAEAVKNGVKISSLGLGYGNNANKTAVMNRLSEKYPDFDLAKAELGYGGAQQEARSVGAAAGKIKLAANSLDRAIPLARSALSKVDLSQFSDLNAFENYARTHSGDPNISALDTALKTVMSDYSALIARSGQSTDSTRAAAREMINANMAPGQLEAVFDQMEKEKDAQLQAIEDTRGNNSKIPSEVTPEEWSHMTAEEKALWQN